VSTEDTVKVNSVTAHFNSNPYSGAPPLPVVFTDSSSANVNSWTWNYGDGSTGSGSVANHTYGSAGVYTVTLTVRDTFGCTSVYDQTITVTDLPSWIIVPNVFTPNGDGTNDGFYISSSGISTFNARIFDRWGVLLAELTQAGQSWDGYTIAGRPATDGTYFYIITAQGADGKLFNLEGFITLIRP
jgi:gliding motility-associated-like protein